MKLIDLGHILNGSSQLGWALALMIVSLEGLAAA